MKQGCVLVLVGLAGCRDTKQQAMLELERRGIMFGAGPLFPPGTDMWQGEGMVIIRAASHAEATEIAASDPMHKSGMREFTVREWMMNEGTITLKVSYSNGKGQVI